MFWQILIFPVKQPYTELFDRFSFQLPLLYTELGFSVVGTQ